LAVDARAFTASDAEAWDALVVDAVASSFLQTRRFLSYHGDRFNDASVCVTDGDGQLVGVLPAAVDLADERRVVSHPGSTYGGLVHGGALRGEAMLEALGAVASYLAGRGFEVLEYKPLPWIYHARPEQDDLYALFRLGAQRSRVDLSCAVDLESGAQPSSRRRRGHRKAVKAGVVVRSGTEHASQVWDVLEQTLASRHDARPVHSLDEILLLAERFPREIEFLVGELEGAAIAGVVLFHGGRVSHAQYIASSPEGNQVGALDAVFAHAIEAAQGAGRRFFDFGTSNRERGLVLNASLYEYKAQYGGGGVVYEAYELSLSGSGTPSSL
jgi:hypothetical protein